MTEMTEQEAAAWRPEIVGWSDDILPYYVTIAEWLPNESQIVEIGVAHGRSALFMCERLGMLGKTVDFWAVDTSPRPAALVNTPVLYEQATSTVVAELFDDGECAFVFIDADHSYEGVKADIAAWRPKIQPGGILAGHDYSRADWPGVVKAVDEAFGAAVLRPGRSIWEVRL